MPASDGLNPYATHSYRFGGNWVLMNRLLDLTVDQLGFLKQQIERYKEQRIEIAGGKVFHHVAPNANSTDAIQSYSPASGTSIAVITRAAAGGASFIFRPKGLDPDQRYFIWFDIDPNVYTMIGSQLMTDGVRVMLPTPFSSDVVHIQGQVQ